jgi:hypothetical protein
MTVTTVVIIDADSLNAEKANKAAIIADHHTANHHIITTIITVADETESKAKDAHVTEL